MKKIILLGVLLIIMINLFAQTETFDLVTFSTPKGWTKETLETTASLTSVDKNKGNWCRITVVKSTASKGSIESDFENEWAELVVKAFNVTDPPDASDVQEADGWKVKGGVGKFVYENNNMIVLMTTFTGFERCLSIIAVTNNQECLASIQTFFETVSLQKPKPGETPAVKPSNASNDAITDQTSVIGIWQKTSTNNDNYSVNNGLHGYFHCQYTFNKDGTYAFISRIFNYLPDILLAKESGTFTMTGNTVTLTPQKSVIEKWTKGTIIDNTGKKATVDKLGKLVTSQKRPLEKTTYTFNKEYFSGIAEWSLQLKSNKETLRDGPFNGGSSFPNTWFYKAVTSDVFLVKTD